MFPPDWEVNRPTEVLFRNTWYLQYAYRRRERVVGGVRVEAMKATRLHFNA